MRVSDARVLRGLHRFSEARRITLVRQHEGRKKAIDDARGARLGTAGLAAFAAVVCLVYGPREERSAAQR
jgi:hypothetical protein